MVILNTCGIYSRSAWKVIIFVLSWAMINPNRVKLSPKHEIRRSVVLRQYQKRPDRLRVLSSNHALERRGLVQRLLHSFGI